MSTTSATIGDLGPLYRRRLAVTTKTLSGIVDQIATPILWVLIVAPALDTALGGFDPTVDYYTYVAVGQVAFLVPFTAMFNGLNVIVDKDFGITRELIVAPVARSAITIANALGVLTIALAQVALIVILAVARGAEFHTSPSGLAWFVAAASPLTLTIYGVAEILALRVGRQEAYGPLIPAVGVTPWFLSGALFPIAVLPAGIELLALLSPWTHAVAVLRHGMMQGDDSRLGAIWHLKSETAMAALSTAVLAVISEMPRQSPLSSPFRLRFHGLATGVPGTLARYPWVRRVSQLSVSRLTSWATWSRKSCIRVSRAPPGVSGPNSWAPRPAVSAHWVKDSARRVQARYQTSSSTA